MSNTRVWDAMARPPATALKRITGGRLQGMTDVNPQWRYRVMTETFGPCGEGWRYEIARTWTEPGTEGQVLAFAEVRLYVCINNGWSEPIPGIGGSMLVAKESAGLRANDEALKMAVTDALSVAMKMLGVAADIYAGLWDGSKYKDGNGGGSQVKMPTRNSQRAAAPSPAASSGGGSEASEQPDTPETSGHRAEAEPPSPSQQPRTNFEIHDQDYTEALEQSVAQQAGYIDQKQVASLHIAAREGGHDPADVKLWLSRRGIHSSKQVPAKSYRAIRERLADKAPLSADS